MLYCVAYTQKKKISHYRHCVQLFCKTVLILTKKKILKIKFMLCLTNVNIFNKTFWKYTNFLHQNYTRRSIWKLKMSKLKNQSSAPQTISGSTDGNSRICCMTREFKKFASGHEAITSCWRHYHPNFKWCRYPWSPQRRFVIFTARPLKTCLQTIYCLFIASKTACYVSNTCTCFKTSKRGISVICW